eukprot:c554_g1_i2.p1 GENE.c554_g1_i2~~c554_g1_i2.p1  ORF type:complete len:157 (+),score=17.09 c554_g1_i2:46-516(+)
MRSGQSSLARPSTLCCDRRAPRRRGRESTTSSFPQRATLFAEPVELLCTVPSQSSTAGVVGLVSIPKLTNDKIKINERIHRTRLAPFDKCYEGAVNTERDSSHGMVRTEITCARCDGHLGHVFDGQRFAKHERHCVNSISVKYVPDTMSLTEKPVL